MIKEKVALNNIEQFSKKYVIPKEKLTKAIEEASKKLEDRIERYGDTFPGTSSVNYKYTQGSNDNWVCGMLTGTYLLAYELTGNKRFREVAERQLHTYRERFDKQINISDHDIGFVFSPSVVAAYKLWGKEAEHKLALEAADYLYRYSYSKKGGFIIRCAKKVHEEWACRTMMDSMLNIPLLFWAGKETGRQEYIDAAIAQRNITEKYLIREDGSSFHHYQFDVGTHKPVRGLTLQGYSDDSCWSRGHAWGILGFPIAYSYTKDKSLLSLHRDVTYYMLNHLPEDMIPSWDLIFTGQDEQPRDSSAGLIAVCGMHEMCKYLSEDDPQKRIFESAGAQMLEAVIDKCTGDIGVDYDGLVCHVSHAVPQKTGIEECAVYGDYFYLEALIRYINPSWKCYW